MTHFCQYDLCAREFTPAKQGPRKMFCSKRCHDLAVHSYHSHKGKVKCWLCRGFGIINIGVKDAKCIPCKGTGRIKR